MVLLPIVAMMLSPAGAFADAPGFVQPLRHGEIEPLNRVWATSFESWDALDTPPGDSPGRIDLERFATEAYVRFYGTLFDKVLRPALGDLEYGTIGPGEPYNEIGSTGYLYWLPDKGHFRAPMAYPVLEASSRG